MGLFLEVKQERLEIVYVNLEGGVEEYLHFYSPLINGNVKINSF